MEFSFSFEPYDNTFVATKLYTRHETFVAIACVIVYSDLTTRFGIKAECNFPRILLCK